MLEISLVLPLADLQIRIEIGWGICRLPQGYWFLLLVALSLALSAPSSAHFSAA